MLHHIGRGTVVLQFVSHEIHVGGYVLEEAVIAEAEVVETGVAVAVAYEAVFGALAVAREKVVAFFALLWQHTAFHLGKFVLLGRIHHFGDGLVAKVAEQMFGIYEVVARIHVAIVLHNAGVAALFGENAHSGGFAHPVSEGCVEKLNVVFTHIVPHPLVEDGAKEIAPLLWCDREIDKFAAFLHAGCEMESVGTFHVALHNGLELNVVTANFLEKMVEVEWIVGVEVVDHGKGVPFHAIFVE